MFPCYALSLSRSLPPTLHSQVYSLCLHLHCFSVGSSVPSFWIPYTYVNIQYLSFCFRITSFCPTGSWFIHLIRTDSSSFLKLNNIPLYIHATSSYDSSANGHQGCFHVLATVKKCHSEHWGTCIFFRYGFLKVCSQYWLQYSCLWNPMGRGAWWVTVHRVTKFGHNWSNLALTYDL